MNASEQASEVGYGEGTNSNHPFQCNVCKRSYSRVDHLARHYRSHTNEKPFPCEICGKDFARADLLKRHAANHNLDANGRKRQRQSSPTRSARVSQACTNCATAKLRCGEERPCQRCERKGVPCTFPPGSDSRRSTSHVPQATSLKGSEAPDGRMFDVRAANRAELNQSFNAMDDSSMISPAQLPTPLGSTQVASIPSVPVEGSTVLDFDDSSFADFLKDIMMPNTPDTLGQITLPELAPESYALRDVLNFGNETTSLDLNDFDFGMIGSFNERPMFNFGILEDGSEPPLQRGQETPDVHSGIDISIEAFRKSLWRWTPAQQDHGYAEQGNLSLPAKDLHPSGTRSQSDAVDQRLDQGSRDKILAMLLSTCERAASPRIASSFPSAELLDSFMHLFVKQQQSQTYTWIHLPTLRPSSCRPEFNGIIAAAGAVLSPVPMIQKLGLAIQEAVRLALPKVFESDNRTTRELQVLQAYALHLQIGVWSGSKRKMEIAESHALPMITMLRRAGRYRRSQTMLAAPEPGDDGNLLDTKWRSWVEAESWKRLAFHSLVADAQTSVALLVPPLVSYAEISLELPASQDLWLAKDMYAWRDCYLSKSPGPPMRLTSFPQCIHDARLLEKDQDRIDLQMSTSILLHGIWSLISEYRRHDTIMKMQGLNRSWNAALASSAKPSELCELLEHLKMTVSEWNGGMHPETVLIHELFLMNLHVSFEELQLFAGKDGDEEARRVYPFLRQWFESRESLQAVWHAGQVIRAATRCRAGRLRDFYAIALYHASLAFWTYGMVSLALSRKKKRSSSYSSMSKDSELIYLDGEDAPSTRRLIGLQRGTPVIHDWSKGVDQSDDAYLRLDNPKAVVEAIIDILRRNGNNDGKMATPLAENLSQLMLDLGNAAWVFSVRL